ncbi:hypothetical protein SASPL_144343 [Salvia splendens]|uniref:Myosin V n=1 Tax=Salvia splendens TaxID=180675 RepID=A0A8X8WF22_SALSN|nr:myosin-2-like [Salvia splendens]KAG6393772.1 hypothetical protein SASPL_144343 [Salvia splendens]
MSSSAAPGSLEEMLENLRRRNPQKPKDLPPALPARPTSRTRLPSNRRAALPDIVEAVMELSSLNHCGNSEGSRWKSAAAKTVRQVKLGELPCVAAASDESKLEEKLASLPPASELCHEKEGSSFTESELQQDTECFIEQIGAVEMQKCFRGHLACRDFHQLKDGSITLQSYVRGEIARREYIALLKKKVDSQRLDEAVVQLQSIIRGWVIRRQYIECRELEESNTSEAPETMISQTQEVRTGPSLSANELQKHLVIAESNLAKKEREIVVLREQLEQYEAKLLGYESKMKSPEEMWRNQEASLQMSLVAARKSTSSEKSNTEKSSDTESPQFYDCDDASSVISSSGSLAKFPCKSITASTCGDMGGLELAVPLVNEQKRHKYGDEARAMIKLKSLNIPWLSPIDELHNLKNRLSAWKMGFKSRSKDANAKSQKPGEADGNKARRKWASLKLK